MNYLKILGPVSALLLAFAACNPETKKQETIKDLPKEPQESPVADLDYTIVTALPHDTLSFTEGLLFHDNKLFESTGSPQGDKFRSVFGPVDAKTGKIDVKGELDKEVYFGEGIVFFKDKIYQLTYRNNVGFIYDAKNYKKMGQFSYTGEGWGVITDGTNIIMSDGTENLRYFDSDFRQVKVVSVTENGYTRDAINELEFINGFIYANIWMTGYIVKIDPANGKVVAKINLTALSYDMRNLHPAALEMNGIAYDAAHDKIYVTGKAWPFIYEIKFAH